tara:strand:- start:209 stop:502 length:294 start_codon:yes stop_codon:yes gene_type:complete
MEYWVYMLKCSDGSFYTGQTTDLEYRLAQHHQCHFPDCYTAKRLPVQLVFHASFESRYSALAREQQIKKWSRKKKQALACGDWDALSFHAKNRRKVY